MGTRPRWTDLGDADDPKSLLANANAFLDALGVANYSKQTVQTRRKHLRPFLQWCNERSVKTPDQVTSTHLERYQTWLHRYCKPDGHKLDAGTQRGMLVTLRTYFRWLTRARRIPFNPASERELPRQGSRLPRNVFNPEEVERILALPDVKTTLGLRDRAILETLYSTGLRRQELAALKLQDVDAIRSVVCVNRGKGDKDRVVPIGERALAWVTKYEAEARPKLVVPGRSEGAIFLTRLGTAFTANALSALAADYIDEANLGKTGACHAFRHSMATAMLENGADIRFIQEILGHSKVTSTAIYTHVAIGKLQAVHRATHPAAMLTGAPPVEPEPPGAPKPERP